MDEIPICSECGAEWPFSELNECNECGIDEIGDCCIGEHAEHGAQRAVEEWWLNT